MVVLDGDGAETEDERARRRAVLAMQGWVEDGTPPGTLVLGLGAISVENNHQLGYATDPLQYFFCEFAGDCP